MATYSAHRYQDRVNGLILQNTIVSAKSIVHDKAPLLDPFVPFVLRLNLRNDDKIKEMSLPMMFIISLNDTSTGPHQMEMLYDAAIIAKERDRYIVPGAEHYLPWYYGGKEYDIRLSDFITRNNNPKRIKGLHKILPSHYTKIFNYETNDKNYY